LAYSIGIKPDEFWQSIPSEFIKYHRSRFGFIQQLEKRADVRSALICATIANFSMNKKKGKTFQAKDFMQKEKIKMTDEEMFNAFTRVAKGMERRVV